MQSDESSTEKDIEDYDDFVDNGDFTLRTKKIAVAGVLAALSVAVAPIAQVIPRIPGWQIALFDPVSIFWIIAFLIGGIEVGVTSMTVGTIALFFFDPSAPIGPLLKFAATAPMIIIPWLGMKVGDTETAGKGLDNLRNYAALMVVGTIIRLVIMIPLNLIIVPLFFGIDNTAFLITYAIILNIIQAFWDTVIPYGIVHKTTLFEEFGLW
ncbi:MAG: hypothetical protein R6V83_05045 [Candidatus Thorarchaeota archaeon]